MFSYIFSRLCKITESETADRLRNHTGTIGSIWPLKQVLLSKQSLSLCNKCIKKINSLKFHQKSIFCYLALFLFLCICTFLFSAFILLGAFIFFVWPLTFHVSRPVVRSAAGGRCVLYPSHMAMQLATCMSVYTKQCWNSCFYYF